ncbi:MAG: hypothetical protein ACXVII_24905, partial [Solirubrobacteraceae bacterium]
MTGEDQLVGGGASGRLPELAQIGRERLQQPDRASLVRLGRRDPAGGDRALDQQRPLPDIRPA